MAANFLPWLQQSFSSSSSLLFAASITFLLLLNILTFRKRKHNLPPGPPRLPIIGNLHQLGTAPHLSLTRLAKKYGPIIHLQFGHIPTVIISSARLAKEVMTTHDLALANRPQLFSAKYLLYNCSDIAFSPYGGYWRHVRKICVHELLSPKQVQVYSFVRKEEVARLLGWITESSPSGITDLSKLFAMYANDIISRVLLGRAFSGEGEYDKYGFYKLLEELQELLGGLSLGDFFPSFEYLLHSLTGVKSRLIETSYRFDQIFDEVIEDHRNPNKRKGKQNDLVDLLLEIQKDESNEFPLTMDNVKAIILSLFVAGTDSTAITLDWGMTELIMNPHVMKKAQEEIRSIVGDQRDVLETDLPQLHYLKAVIKEIFRLHPAAPILVRREYTEEIIIEGYEIPAGTRFFVNVWAIGRDSEVWENPDKFEPERFLGSPIDFKGQDFELIPFGAGRRNCPGITFAVPTVELALAQLLHRFDWELPPGTEAKDLDMTEVFGITMHRKEHLMVVAKPYFA